MSDKKEVRRKKRITIKRAFMALLAGELAAMLPFTIFITNFLLMETGSPRYPTEMNFVFFIVGIGFVYSFVILLIFGSLSWFICAKLKCVNIWSATLIGALIASSTMILFAEMQLFHPFFRADLGLVLGAISGSVTCYIAYRLPQKDLHSS